MSQPPLVLEALRLPELYRRVCLHAGLPLPTAPGGPVERFVVRCGDEPPTILAGLLEEALLEDRAEVTVLPAGGPPDYGSLPAGGIAVRPGFEGPCPDEGALRRSASTGGG